MGSLRIIKKNQWLDASLPVTQYSISNRLEVRYSGHLSFLTRIILNYHFIGIIAYIHEKIYRILEIKNRLRILVNPFSN